MKIIQLPDVLHDYLVHVVERHAQQGIHPEEGTAIAQLWEYVTKNVQHLDDQELRKMAAAGTPTGQSTVPPAEPTIVTQERVYKSLVRPVEDSAQDKNPTTSESK
jgi:hypothetical protein